MAKRSGRRKIRHLLVRGWGYLLELLGISHWKKILLAFWSGVVFVATVTTLLAAYPWLELQKDESLSPHNPFGSMFVLVNQGYAPVANIEVDCVSSFDTNGGRFRNIHLRTSIRDNLWHASKVTLPCMRTMGYDCEPYIPNSIFGFSSDYHVERADMNIEISYRAIGIFRRSQTFHVVALRAVGNSYRWEFGS